MTERTQPKIPGDKRRSDSSSGFTLLEVMVALSIIAIVLVYVFHMHTGTISMNRGARFDATAPLLAQRKLSEILMRPSDEIASDTGGFGEDFPGYHWRLDITDVSSEALADAAERLKKIDLVVSLNEKEFTYQLSTYRNFWK